MTTVPPWQWTSVGCWHPPISKIWGSMVGRWPGRRCKPLLPRSWYQAQFEVPNPSDASDASVQLPETSTRFRFPGSFLSQNLQAPPDEPFEPTNPPLPTRPVWHRLHTDQKRLPESRGVSLPPHPSPFELEAPDVPTPYGVIIRVIIITTTNTDDLRVLRTKYLHATDHSGTTQPHIERPSAVVRFRLATGPG